ncbi:hypothetical protein NEUTE1DRAFT_93219 [Neurospora tetrasperma FGSC 2508]|uniref:Uncharacterized protein n=1 Tax=Neurospora tetrasperma (strain FGSC 2508 / ATCC MYA-4615 / P0657) TaxID=510951 RepID=F8MZ86_NEUT8|nr:uncharacterized protein NEUTE1DRAFT_93219 [Neurospora tetrasperma FGSC 2508]EGO53678.1 hypothetical protein NEUTE1DRAFT_93219 [Neurospora tetrasperma FGSC 2508]EGZ76250.1 hypothetical protein NEUTE2DRAFT_97935 [Neurospora tetrasperma FGSC 2509]
MYSLEIQNYPHLTPSEFAEAAHHLDRRYSQATLGPLRRQWKLRVRSALNTHFVSPSDPEYSTFIQITRPLEVNLDDDGLSEFLDNLSFSERPAAVRGDEGEGEGVVGVSEGMEVEDDDDEQKTSYGYVTYEIHLHPTYQAPCLWFSLNGLPVDEPAFNIDTVFRRLVPDQFKDGLRRAGSVGGISADVSFLISSHPVLCICILRFEWVQSSRCWKTPKS